jgi:hypothetical protein
MGSSPVGRFRGEHALIQPRANSPPAQWEHASPFDAIAEGQLLVVARVC